MKGESHGRAKLTGADVEYIRSHYTPGNNGGRPEYYESQTSLTGLAKRFGVSHRQIRRIVAGENWSHIK